MHAYSSWQDLSVGTNIFQLMTLTYTFDLILRNLKCLPQLFHQRFTKVGSGVLVPLGQPRSSLNICKL